MRGIAENPVSHARSRSAKKAQGTKGIYANQVMMRIHANQKGIVMQTKGIVMQTKS